MKTVLLRHLKGEGFGRFPVWMMRQAGRYLPNYQEIRGKYSFWEMVTHTEVAKRISLMPLDYFPVDAVIFFSDILSLPYGLGVPIAMKEAVGPVNQTPFLKEEDFCVFDGFSFDRHTGFVGETISAIRRELSPETTLLGFAGAPWTIACYLIEDNLGKKRFERIHQWMFQDPEGLGRLLEKIATATVIYLKGQYRAGAHVVQLFDTWLSEMPRDFFVRYYLKILAGLTLSLKKDDDIPIFFYSKRTHHLLRDFLVLPFDVLSVDSLWQLGDIEEYLGGRFSLQGNLDSVQLLGEESQVRKATRLLVEHARGLSKPAILNLGHGVLPHTPVLNAKVFVEEAQRLWD